jgi:hypothetical protein
MKQEFFVQVGITTLRSPDDSTLMDVPLYIKVTALNANGLSESKENLLSKISDVLIKQHEKKIMQTLAGLKKQKGGAANVVN